MEVRQRLVKLRWLEMARCNNSSSTSTINLWRRAIIHWDLRSSLPLCVVVVIDMRERLDLEFPQLEHGKMVV
jgi:hypothetical protein